MKESFDVDALLRDLHAGHECEAGPCVCICGCDVRMQCRTIMGSLCSVCTLRYDRGDDTHGLPPDHGLLPEMEVRREEVAAETERLMAGFAD